MKRLLAALIFIVFALATGYVSVVHAAVSNQVIIIAVVDDAFQVDNPLFKGMLWRNSGEIPNNGRDDDGNGYIDDIIGWDASDQDEGIASPKHRLNEFAHGTHIAVIIARTIRQQLGELEDYPIKLMPIKAVSDSAVQMNMKDGYLGIRYALENGADLINLSWSGGELDQAAKQLLAEARQRDILVVGSVGTYPQRDVSLPAAHPSVMGVAGVDDKNILYSSNYGLEVDISALSKWRDVKTELDGVSNSVALVTATMAIMKYRNPIASNTQIKYCLQKTAKILDAANPTIAGQLGAGLLSTKDAISCVENINLPVSNEANYSTRREQPKGSLIYQYQREPKTKTHQWLIKPTGQYAGLELKPYVEGDSGDSSLEVYTVSSQQDKKQEIVWRGLLKELPDKISTKKSAIKIILHAKSEQDFQFVARYATYNINFSERYCRGITTINIDDISTPVMISDGSAGLTYAAESDCKWLVKPKPGFNLKLEFIKVDTELEVDGIHIFRGATTSQSNFLMKITGDRLPPTIIVERDPVLIWFTSDKQNHGDGFSVRVSNTQKQ